MASRRGLLAGLLFCLIIVSGLPGQLLSAGKVSYHVKKTIVLKNNGYSATKVIILVPVPQTSQYQEVKNLKYGSGLLMRTSNTDDLFVKYIITSGLPGSNTSKEVAVIEYDITLNEVVYSPNDNDAVTYNRNSAEYTYYTRGNLPYIDPSEARIKQIADRLWNESGRKVIAYARKAYEYTASNYRYMNANTGMYALTDILNQGGGDCGNLSSIFISLCRAKGIPARHLIAYGPGPKWHAWAEFYAGSLGWIPVDVTYKNTDRNGNYFGRYAFNERFVVLNRDLNLGVESDPGVPYTAPLLQSYVMWKWGQGDSKKLQAEVNINFTENQAAVQPNATIGSLNVVYPDSNKVRIDVNEVYAYNVLNQDVYFQCEMFQGNTAVAGTLQKSGSVNVGYDPGYWQGAAISFEYMLFQLRQKADKGKDVEAEVSVVLTRTNKVIGKKRVKVGLFTFKKMT